MAARRLAARRVVAPYAQVFGPLRPIPPVRGKCPKGTKGVGIIGPYMEWRTSRIGGPHKSPAERVLWGEDEQRSE